MTPDGPRRACWECSGGTDAFPPPGEPWKCVLDPPFLACDLLRRVHAGEEVPYLLAQRLIRSPVPPGPPYPFREGSVPAEPEPSARPVAALYRETGAGDVLMGTVALRGLKEGGYETLLLTQPTYAPLLRLCPDVDRVAAVNERPTGNYDLFFDLDVGSPGQFDFVAGCERTERIDLILDVCGVQVGEKAPRLELTAGERRYAAALWESYGWGPDPVVVAISPFSESVPRSLTWHGARRVAQFVRSSFPEAKILWLGQEREGMEPGEDEQTLAGAPLRVVAAAVERCALLITTDAFPMHLGEALGVPTIALFSEVAAATRTSYYDFVHPVEWPAGCPYGIYPCDGRGWACLNTPCISRLPRERWTKAFRAVLARMGKRRRPGTTPRTFSPASGARFWRADTRREFYAHRSGADVDIGEDRTVSSHDEYPRVRWMLERVQGFRVLDVGSAGGNITRALAKTPHRRVVDVVEPGAEWAAHMRGQINGQVYEEFIEDLLARKDTADYDTIVLADVIEHLENPERVLVEIVTKWKPGRILITTPNGRWPNEEHLHEFDEAGIRELVDPLEGTSEAIYDPDGRLRWWGGMIDRPARRRRAT